MHSLTCVCASRTWVEQALSFISSLRKQEQFTLSSLQHSPSTMKIPMKLCFSCRNQSMSTAQCAYSKQLSTNNFLVSFESCTVPRLGVSFKDCEQNTHPNSMYRCAQCVPTHTEQNDHISSREHAWLKIAHLCVPQQLSNTCVVSFLAAPDTDHKHKFSLTCLTYISDDLLITPKAFWRTIHIYPAKFHSRVADQHKSHLSQVTSPK